MAVMLTFPVLTTWKYCAAVDVAVSVNAPGGDGAIADWVATTPHFVDVIVDVDIATPLLAALAIPTNATEVVRRAVTTTALLAGLIARRTTID